MIEDWGSEASLFLWHTTFVLLAVLAVLSYMVYHSIRNRLFAYYCIYLVLLLSYILLKNDFYWVIPPTKGVVIYTYAIQILYLCFYVYFGMHYVHLQRHVPSLYQLVLRYLRMVLGITVIWVIGCLADVVPYESMREIYYVYFFPVHTVLALYLLYRIYFLPNEPLKKYLIIGSGCYIVFGCLAIISSVWFLDQHSFSGTAYFYIGISLECLFFALGLGEKIRRHAVRTLQIERELNHTQAELQTQLQKQLQVQTLENIRLEQARVQEQWATQIAVLKNRVLRSQMNSHFLFNVLNSIKAYIVEQQTDLAVKYLSQYAKLIRTILEASRTEHWTLFQEAKALELYIGIEKIRYEQQVHFVWNWPEDSRIHAYPFPSLLLQPIVENALEHGLNRASGSVLTILINMDYTNDSVNISIEDNGKGYWNTQPHEATTKRHQSVGIQLVKERVQAFNQFYSQWSLDFYIESQLGQTGTCVSFLLQTKSSTSPIT